MSDFQVRHIPLFVLILGSYDSNTRQILYALREEIAKIASVIEGIDIIALLLAKVKVFEINTKTRQFTVMAELNEESATLYIFEQCELIDVIQIKTDSIESRIKDIINEKWNENVEFFLEKTILNKLDLFLSVPSFVIVVRHEELTRGGEYIELTYLLLRGIDPKSIFFFKKDNIKLSEMCFELLDAYKVAIRPYRSIEDLLNEAKRLLLLEIKKMRNILQQCQE